MIKFLLYRLAYNHLNDIKQVQGEWTQSISNLDREKIDGQSFQLLWELYHNDVFKLNLMITSITVPRPANELYASHIPDNLQTLRNFLYPFGFSKEDDLANNPILLQIIGDDVQKAASLNDEQLKAFTDRARTAIPGYSVDSPERTTDLKLYRSPKWAQMKDTMDERFKDCLQAVKQNIMDFLRDPQTGRVYRGKRTLRSKELSLLQNIGSTGSGQYLLFAVSGSGKTRSIKHLLSKRFGFYFQACNLEPTETKSIYEPKRIAGSKDTVSLWRLIQFSKSLDVFSHKELFPSPLNFDFWTNDWIANLVECRLMVLFQYLDVVEELRIPHDDQPKYWYDLQTSSVIDPFDDLFQLSCINPRIFYNRNWRNGESGIRSMLRGDLELAMNSGPARIKMGGGLGLMICLDEAQSDLEVTGALTSGTESSLLSAWAAGFEISAACLGKIDLSCATFYSGTSLRLQEAADNLQIAHYSFLKIRTSYDHRRSIEWRNFQRNERIGRPFVISEYPLLTEAFQLETIIEELEVYTIIGNTEAKQTLSRQLLRYWTPLKGRPGWSARYIKLVKSILSSKDVLSLSDTDLKNIVQHAANTTRGEIKQFLKDRLKQLQRRTELIEDLCWVAIESDLLDEPKAFMDEHGPDLVSNAFAILKPARVGLQRYYLQESLAAEAIEEYFLREDSVLVSRCLHEFIEARRHDMSALGKAAEWLLGWVSFVTK
jgi:hypothetical protein